MANAKFTHAYNGFPQSFHVNVGTVLGKRFTLLQAPMTQSSSHSIRHITYSGAPAYLNDLWHDTKAVVDVAGKKTFLNTRIWNRSSLDKSVGSNY